MDAKATPSRGNRDVTFRLPAVMAACLSLLLSAGAAEAGPRLYDVRPLLEDSLPAWWLHPEPGEVRPTAPPERPAGGRPAGELAPLQPIPNYPSTVDTSSPVGASASPSGASPPLTGATARPPGGAAIEYEALPPVDPVPSSDAPGIRAGERPRSSSGAAFGGPPR